MQALIENSWRGNVRELMHVVERAVLMAQDNFVRVRDLALRDPKEGGAKLDEMSLEEVEETLVKKALAKFDGNVSLAAAALGLSRSALYRRLQRFGL
jgi:transcriptional regulator of acetoin/glycerol metabolism